MGIRTAGRAATGAEMRAIAFIVIGFIFVAAGVTGLIHPQWQGRDKKMDVDVQGSHYVVNTRRIVDIPPIFCGAVLVAGLCTAALGGITRSKARRTHSDNA
jgi:hypothetical protein